MPNKLKKLLDLGQNYFNVWLGILSWIFLYTGLDVQNPGSQVVLKKLSSVTPNKKSVVHTTLDTTGSSTYSMVELTIILMIY